jgi:hypothetical protein
MRRREFFRLFSAAAVAATMPIEDTTMARSFLSVGGHALPHQGQLLTMTEVMLSPGVNDNGDYFTESVIRKACEDFMAQHDRAPSRVWHVI